MLRLTFDSCLIIAAAVLLAMAGGFPASKGILVGSAACLLRLSREKW